MFYKGAAPRRLEAFCRRQGYEEETHCRGIRYRFTVWLHPPVFHNTRICRPHAHSYTYSLVHATSLSDLCQLHCRWQCDDMD